ncbi:uncharacterized protein ACRADG_008729 isoform 1-T3 [Cochliomyia hominivorax]
MRSLKFQNRNNSMQHKVMTLLYWIPMGVMLLQQMTLSAAVKFKGDTCLSKGTGGICREWSECPVIKTLIERGEYTNREVVSCGFGIREELICCPNTRSVDQEDTTTLQNTDRVKTTTEGAERDFWLDLTTSSTTASPDFWLPLVPSTTPTTTTTTTTTTIKPLILGDQRLNESSEFFDLNALLSGNQNGGRKTAQEINLGRPNNPSNQGFVNQNSNGRGNLNSGPVNLNQWSFNNSPATGPQSNNGRGNSNGFRGNGNGHFGRGQQNIGRVQLNQPQNFGRGQQNNGRGQQNNGRGHHNNGNNGRGRNSNGNGNQNRGFIFPENVNRPNVLENEQVLDLRPIGPANIMEDQKPNIGDQRKTENLIRDIFNTTEIVNNNNNKNQALPAPVVPNAGNTEEKQLDNLIANLFNVNSEQTPTAKTPNQSNQPVVWLNPQENPNNQVEFSPKPQQQHQHQQMEFSNPQLPGHFQVVPTIQNPITNNNLDAAPSTSFIQQPVVVETWSSNPAPQTEFNPIQVVYENLVNSGMDITKAEQVPIIFNQPQQQQFIAHPQFGPVVVPQTGSQPFVQQPQFFHQSPLAPQNFGQHTSEQLVQQSEASSKEPRSTSPIQQLVQEPNRVSAFNIQSPPSNILDPFKPFEFRPPPEDENALVEDNNSLSSNPTPKPDTSKDRPAVRACRRIESGLTPYLTDHILGGTPAEKGEFPHMVALGYSRIGGDDRPPYDIRCGGTLIDKRFVLTAAHCVAERDNVPVIVRLGVVNFSDPVEMSTAVELRIKETYIHDDYSTRLTYNDIAILELERDVETNENIYPVCLYTNEKDPDTNIRLWVTGWGTYNTTTRSFSNILLKAPLHTSPLENCNKSFTEYGLNRRIPEGIIRTQFCAEDKDQIRDACQGDSGGPLNLIVDESYKNYRLVGVVSSGFGCASSTPGLYTRVAAFLDFIEKIVWPNGGD